MGYSVTMNYVDITISIAKEVVFEGDYLSLLTQ